MAEPRRWRVFTIALVGVALAVTLTAPQVLAQELTQAQQYFQSGRAYHLGEDGKKADLEKALRQYLLALSADPQFFEAHVNAGKTYVARKDYRRAKVHFSDAIKIARQRPDLTAVDEAQISSDLGVCYFKEGKLKEAEKWFRGAVGLNPAQPEAHYNLINLLLSDERQAEARQQLQVAIEAAPSERYGIFQGRLKTQESYAEWNPLWLKIAVGAALGGAVLLAMLRAVKGSGKGGSKAGGKGNAKGKGSSSAKSSTPPKAKRS